MNWIAPHLLSHAPLPPLPFYVRVTLKAWLSGAKAKARARAADSDPTGDAAPDQGSESSSLTKTGGSTAAHGRGLKSDSGSKIPTSNVVTVGKKKKIPIVATEHVASENP